MKAAPIDKRFCRELAEWWPLISPVAGHETRAAYLATLLHSAGIAVQDVLELGSGDGETAAHLKHHFALTLVDLNPEMLAASRDLNPQCRHFTGDMRSVRLPERFDAVVIGESIGHLTSEEDLLATCVTAFEHCRPGGMAVFLPGHVTETYAPGAGSFAADDDDGRSARHHTWTWDPNPRDTWVLTTHAFVLRHPDGTLNLDHETRRLGLFDRSTWLAVLSDAGFEASAVEDDTEDDTENDGTGEPAPARTVFIGYRPGR
ncbi:MAG: hypothetical protein QG622_945 [Actinomycetota bacterium]|nr:hypothetical protein [Actinomycetota bacterium]